MVWLLNHIPYFAREDLRRERLLEQLDASIEHPVISDVVVGVAGDVENLNPGSRRRKFHRQFRAIHVRHNYVRNQKVNRAIKFFRHPQGFSSLASAQDVVSFLRQHVTDEFAHDLFVFDHEHGLEIE